MENSEIILYEIKDSERIKHVIKQAAEYAVLSSPFTINRMNYNDISTRVNNIFKGKIAELLLFELFLNNKLPVETEPCKTPFYQTDKRDFILGDYEFDIKNNFYWDIGGFSDFIKLPALVPNRDSNDQWSKRDESMLGKKTAFVFTFMKHGDIINNRRNNTFLKINFNTSHLNLLKGKIDKYKGRPVDAEPQDMKHFLNNFGDIISNNYPSSLAIIITAYATKREFDLFKDVNGFKVNQNYMHQPWPNWYQQRNNGANFLNGVFFTKIKNATCPIVLLPSFKSLINHYLET